jgi:hypothetical protein
VCRSTKRSWSLIKNRKSIITVTICLLSKKRLFLMSRGVKLRKTLRWGFSILLENSKIWKLMTCIQIKRNRRKKCWKNKIPILPGGVSIKIILMIAKLHMGIRNISMKLKIKENKRN